MRTELLQALRPSYDPARLAEIDQDFLSFEEDLTTMEDLQRVPIAIQNGLHFEHNPHNSILLYLTGLTSQFNHEVARANTRGGSPPDIDIDFEALGRDRAVDWVVEEWGREHVANIMTQGTFKPKSLTRRFHKITDGDPAQMREILRKFPKAVFGKEPKLEKIVESAPELKNPQYADWLDFTTRLEGMIANFGIHAAGIVISGHPIPDTIPCWKNKKSEFITQYDMHEVEELGSIKFDFLVINNLDILKACVQLIKERHGKEYDIYDVADFDEKAYKLMASGLLTGVFQMETSGSAKTLIHKIEPSNLEELSDINALNRPGPMSAGLDDAYIENKKNGYAPDDMPEAIAEVLKTTYWTLVYQEQVMALCTVAGFTLQEADDVRRAMGKKKHDILGGFKIQFVDGMVAKGIDKAYAEDLWVTLAGDPEDPDNNGFADYCFNKSHSLAYSVVTYLCAYFKANYPTEFFTALMSVRSQVMQPKDWKQKAPEFVNEAKRMNVHISASSIQASAFGFTIQDDKVYFGLNAIKNVGVTACRSIITARKKGRFKDIWDFLARINRRKVTTRTFEALVMSGAFDRMGYMRKELLDNTKAIYAYFNDRLEYEERIQEQRIRAAENAKKEVRREQITSDVKQAKLLVRKFKKQKAPIPQGIERLATREARLREMRSLIRESGQEPHDVLDSQDLDEYNESLWLRKRPELKLKDEPTMPELTRTKQVKINVKQLMEQAEYIGCYLQQHPAPVLYPDTTRIADASIGDYLRMAGQITSYKEITTRKGQQMAFLAMGDGTGIAELVLFPRQWSMLKNINQLPQIGDIVATKCEVEDVMDDGSVKVIANRIDIYRPN